MIKIKSLFIVLFMFVCIYSLSLPIVDSCVVYDTSRNSWSFKNVIHYSYNSIGFLTNRNGIGISGSTEDILDTDAKGFYSTVIHTVYRGSTVYTKNRTTYFPRIYQRQVSFPEKDFIVGITIGIKAPKELVVCKSVTKENWDIVRQKWIMYGKDSVCLSNDSMRVVLNMKYDTLSSEWITLTRDTLYLRSANVYKMSDWTSSNTSDLIMHDIYYFDTLGRVITESTRSSFNKGQTWGTTSSSTYLNVYDSIGNITSCTQTMSNFETHTIRKKYEYNLQRMPISRIDSSVDYGNEKHLFLYQLFSSVEKKDKISSDGKIKAAITISADGKISINSSTTSMNDFVVRLFRINGTHIVDIPANQSNIFLFCKHKNISLPQGIYFVQICNRGKVENTCKVVKTAH